MRCRQCGTELDRPGDRCLSCDRSHTDAIVLEVTPERATLTFIEEDAIHGETTITTTAESEERLRERQRRNYAERIAAEIRRKGAQSVYTTGDRELIRRLRQELAIDVYRIDAEDPVGSFLKRRNDAPLAVVDGAASTKLGGSHSTVIGDRRGRSAIELLGDHPHVKKIIPGPIDASGHGSQGGFRAKVTRSDDRGNLRVLLHDGSSVQTVRVVTTGRSREDGERIAAQLTEAFTEES